MGAEPIEPQPTPDRQLSLPVYFDDAVPGVGEVVALGGSEGRHAVAVRRHRPGEHLILTDGAGAWALVEVDAISSRESMRVRVVQRNSQPPPVPHVTVVQALPKSDRSGDAVDLLTEIGVDEIVPWQAHNCVARWDAQRAERGRQRWDRVAAEAAKQSRRVWWPSIAEVADTAGVLARVADADLAVVCDETARQSLVGAAASGARRIVIVIGPEGGLTAQERRDLAGAGAHLRNLGPTVLRAVTAGVVAASVLLSATDRWSPKAAVDGQQSPFGP